MSSKSLWATVTTVLVVVMLLCQSPFSALAAPPSPPTPTSAPTATPVPYPTIPPAPPSGYPVYHVVQWGENLTRIAWRYGTTVWAIAQANGIWNVDYIVAGQVLLIPVSGPAPVPWSIYIVQPGDTLSGIAWRFGTTVWAIAQVNGIWNPHLIYIGQTIYIP
jgi:LysM repeat protein